MTRNALVIIGAAGSAGLLMAALGFQYIDGLAPCPLCIWQRWPHAAVVALGLGFIVVRHPLIPLLAAAALLVGAAIALFHTGVERQWWEGLDVCAGASLGDLSGDDLLDLDAAVSVARCDEVAWSFLGLSMATWNGLLSLILAGVWARAAASS